MADTTENPNEETIKCVVVGNNNVGKTRLICSRAYNEPSPNTRCMVSGSHVPTVWAIDQYRNNKEVLQNARCDIDGTVVSLRLWDTFGDHHKNRRFAYGKADVVVICFSVCDKKSLQQVQQFWMPEVRKHCKSIPVFVVACKVDLRFADLSKLNKSKGVLSKTIRKSDILYPDQCRSIVETLNCPYYETSVLLGYGIPDVFENACRAALLYRRNLYFWNSGFKRIQRPCLQEPLEPPKPQAPQLNVLNLDSNSLPNLYSLYSSQLFADIVFVCQGIKIYAHKTVIAACSNVFYELLDCLKQVVDQTDVCLDNDNSQTDQIRSPQESSLTDEVISKVTNKRRASETANTNKCMKCDLPYMVLSNPDITYCGCDGKNLDVFHVDMAPEIFKIIINFCYCGCLGATKLTDAAYTIDVLTQVIIASQRFGLTSLMKMAAHVINSESENGADDLTKQFIMKRAQNLKSFFLNQECWSDIVFKVKDGYVWGHKILLCSGCDVMNAMLAGTFIESKDRQVDLPFATKKGLCAVLGYIYSNDLSELNDCMDDDFGEVISLANRFCLPGLVAQVECFVVEMFMDHENEYCKSGEALLMSELCEEILWMLEVSQLHNALRLHEWCLHFLCVHYNEACRSAAKSVKSLPDETQKYLVENRWPPVWYIKQRDVYEKRLTERQSEDCPQRSLRKTKKQL